MRGSASPHPRHATNKSWTAGDVARTATLPRYRMLMCVLNAVQRTRDLDCHKATICCACDASSAALPAPSHLPDTRATHRETPCDGTRVPVALHQSVANAAFVQPI